MRQRCASLSRPCLPVCLFSALAVGANAQALEWLPAERQEFCSVAPVQPPKLDEQAAYPAQAPEEQPNHATRTLVQTYRGANRLISVAQACTLAKEAEDAQTEEDDACSQETSTYTFDLLMYAAPAYLSFLLVAVWHTCCYVACCRCCRRCCMCSERKGPRDSKSWQRLIIGLTLFISTIAIFSSAVAAYDRSGQISDGIANMLCNMLTLTDEALNGSPLSPLFLGFDVGIQRIQIVRRLLDVDGTSMTDVRLILDETATFASAMDDLMQKLSHMEHVMKIVGQHKTKEHTCVFCELAVGNNATGEVGLLGELRFEVEQSSADAMRYIQSITAATLTGTSLTDLSSAVVRGGVALQIFRAGFVWAFVDTFVGIRRDLQTAEDARHTVFQCVSAFCVLHAVFLSTAALVYGRRSTAKYPSATPACATWFFAFCTLTLALAFAGVLLVLVIPISELCSFTRYDLLTYEGIEDYHRQLGLVDANDAMDPLAVDVFRSCLTPNGTGDILTALQLRRRLEFQQVLDDKFVELEDKMAGRVVDIAKFELLVSRAQLFGGLFVLDPDDPKPLEPSAAPKMMGSSVDPDDQEGPDGETLIYGLNTYSQLIAGPGQYSFEHGTAGGGTVITATSPSEAQSANLPVQTQHALIYARLKEQLLTEPNLFRCDILDASHQVTEQACGFEDFRASVQEYAEQIRDAGIRLGEEARNAQQLIASDLKSSLLSLLLELRELRTLFHGRFLWRRWEEFDLSLCNAALPAMIESVAAWIVVALFTLPLLVTHYKIWRHFLDNKIVGEELERFSKKYGYLTNN